jgi:hypothetical protein
MNNKTIKRKKKRKMVGMVVHAFHPRYLRGISRRIRVHTGWTKTRDPI